MPRSDITKYPGIAEKFMQLEKSRRRQVITATVDNQTVFTITNGSYVVGSETLDVVVKGTWQPPNSGAYTETSSTSITLSEGVPIGTKVVLYWLEGKLPIQFGHNTTHYKDGQDPIDITKLQGYLESKIDKIPGLIDKTSWVDVREYKPVGDGVANDTTPVQNAINAVPTGGVLLLESGKTYKTTLSLNVVKNLAIRTTGKDKARIYLTSTSNTQFCIYARGTVKSTTTLANSVSVNQYKTVLASNAQVSPGDLLLYKSDKLWYNDNRGYLSKGELHIARSVNANNEVAIYPPMVDGYDTSSETTTVSVISPITVDIDNVEFVRAGTNGTIEGLKLEYCVDSVITNVSAKDCTNAGVKIVTCFNTKVDRMYTERSNYALSGYGVQTYGTAFTLITNSFFWGNRRGVDISGDYPDIFSTVEGCRIFGGGFNRDGLEYPYQDQQHGIGNHSTARYTTIRRNTFGYLSYGINVRGFNTVVEENYFVGMFTHACMSLTYGENITVKKNEYFNGFNGSNDSSSYSPVTNILQGQCPTFVFLFNTYGADKGYINIENNNVRNLTSNFIRIYNFSNSSSPKFTTVKNMTVKDNTIGYQTLADTDSFNMVQSDIDTIYGQNCIFRGNEVQRYAGKGKYISFINFDFHRAATGGGGGLSSSGAPVTYSVVMPDDSYQELPVGGALTNSVRVILDSATGSLNGKLTSGSATLASVDTKSSSVEIAAVPLTGTTGTDGQFTVSYVDGILYLENRRGVMARITFTVMNVS
ncbi:tail spike protein [Bacillus phage Mater]|uniref:Tail spike protein n=1 Tax=Bacillus phage Mater TaxID=1540090 RepID=A0A0A0RMU7_9CAUD|nr:tail spike protein [Bacillus phage Mater]AIW03307.1 tail spike protein [Bacillus phage Mater]